MFLVILSISFNHTIIFILEIKKFVICHIYLISALHQRPYVYNILPNPTYICNNLSKLNYICNFPIEVSYKIMIILMDLTFNYYIQQT